MSYTDKPVIDKNIQPLYDKYMSEIVRSINNNMLKLLNTNHSIVLCCPKSSEKRSDIKLFTEYVRSYLKHQGFSEDRFKVTSGYDNEDDYYFMDIQRI
jgi:hypothetical protein